MPVLDWGAEAKVGSLENKHHQPSGGQVAIVNEKLAWNAQPKVGSLDKKDHKPGGGTCFSFKLLFIEGY